MTDHQTKAFYLAALRPKVKPLRYPMTGEEIVAFTAYALLWVAIIAFVAYLVLA